MLHSLGSPRRYTQFIRQDKPAAWEVKLRGESLKNIQFMKKLLLAIAVLCPSLLFAQSLFDGTWKEIQDQTKFSPKPVTISLRDGMWHNLTVIPNIHVKADGQDQPVSGQTYDTIAVKEIDDHNARVVCKKMGKTVIEFTCTASADGKTLTNTGKSYSAANDQITTYETVSERIGAVPSAANPVSGSWRTVKLARSENDLLSTYKRSGDELAFSDRIGETWTAKFDGKDYPVTGSADFDSVALKEIDGAAIEASFKRAGRLIGVGRLDVSADGKKLTNAWQNKLTGRVTTYVSEKQ
jgi:hypothetical protein